MKTVEVALALPEGYQVIVGQAHFIKTVEDLYEAIVTSMPGVKFGVAFCEASGKALVRSDGSDEKSTGMARDFALELGAGHCFVAVLKASFPINVLNRIKAVEEVTGIYCATANPVTFILGQTETGRGVLGVVDGMSPKGVEDGSEREERKAFLRKIGYKR